MDFEAEITEIKNRNSKVEVDKKWETSITRRLFVSVITYAVALAWLWIINEPNLWLKAFIPPVGYVISTLSLPILKNWWVKST